MIRQDLSQKMSARLSPQQIQFIKLLQVPTIELEARIKQELEENPALADAAEAARDDEQDDAYGDEPEQDDEDEAPDITMDEYLSQEEDYRYRTYQPDDPNAEQYEAPVIQRASLFDNLTRQAGMLTLDDTQEIIAHQIIGSIGGDGYLRRQIEQLKDDLAFQQNLSVTEQEVEDVLKKVQQLDPPGVAARNLRECLLLQLRRKSSADPARNAALKIIENHFDEFTKKHYQKIKDRLNLDKDTLADAWHIIERLNPKPGESETEVKTQYIVPDFILHIENGEPVIRLNRRNAPELRVNKNYLKLFNQLDQQPKEVKSEKKKKEELHFIKQKIDSAKWFIDAIRQRQETLLKTMSCIANKQKDFFLSEGDETKLHPMILKDVADEIGMDISTVSRVANSKYVQTDFGNFMLKFFFSEKISTDSGEDVSNKEVKHVLEELIETEDKHKPHSDDQLTNLLNDRGYKIARRTVAKYREQLNIPVARLRKEL